MAAPIATWTSPKLWNRGPLCGARECISNSSLSPTKSMASCVTVRGCGPTRRRLISSSASSSSGGERFVRDLFEVQNDPAFDQRVGEFLLAAFGDVEYPS